MKKKHDEIELLAKTNLDCIINSLSRPLTNSYIEHNYFLLIDVLRRRSYEKKNKLELKL